MLLCALGIGLFIFPQLSHVVNVPLINKPFHFQLGLAVGKFHQSAGMVSVYIQYHTIQPTVGKVYKKKERAAGGVGDFENGVLLET